MKGSSVFLAACVTLAYAAPSAGVELVWSGGLRNLTFSTSRQCTLLVETTAADAGLPSEWRLVWVATSTSDTPITVQSGTGSDGYADACSVSGPITADDALSQIVSAEHCYRGAGGRATTARYVLAVAGDVMAKLKVVMGAAPSVGAADPEVTLNGGTDIPYPPVILAVTSTRSGDTLTVSATGDGLQEVQQLSFAPRGDGAQLQLSIVRREPSCVVGSTVLSAPLPIGRVVASDGSGFQSAAPLPRDTAAFFQSGHFFIRFQPGIGDLPLGLSGAPLADFVFNAGGLRDSLAALGVGQLRRAFPGFRHSDVHGHNLIGEPVLLDDLADIYVADAAPGPSIGAIAASAASLSGVAWTQPEQAVAGMLFVPNDTLFAQQWALNPLSTALCGQSPSVSIHAPEAWEFTKGDPSVGIAILDTGIDTTHVEMFNHARLLKTNSFPNPLDRDVKRHGTAVAGIAAARGNNTSGIAGVAYEATPWGIPVADTNEVFTVSSVDAGISVAVANHLPIINLSLGFNPPAPAPVNAACLNALNLGHLVVAAMGNWGDNGPVYPAAFPNRVYAVGAVSLNGNRWEDTNLPCYAGGSNFGPWLDVVAPGGDLVFTAKNGPNSYYDLSLCGSLPCSGFFGTSGVAPVVSGVAALLKTYRPKLLGEDLAQIMNRTAQALTFPVPDPTGQYGWGLVRAERALQFVAPPRAAFQGWLGPGGTYGALADSGYVTVPQQTFSNVPGLANGTYSCYRHRMVGNVNFGFGFADSLSLAVWARASGSIGWKDTTQFDYAYEVNWGRPVAGSLTTHGVRMETFLYDVRDANNNQIAWKPISPDSAQIAFTFIGRIPNSLLAADAEKGNDVVVTTVPNPGTRRIQVRFALSTTGVVQATVLDIAGRIVASIVNGRFAPGPHEVMWDVKDSSGRACAAGVYFLRFDTGIRCITKKFIVLKG